MTKMGVCMDARVALCKGTFWGKVIRKEVLQSQLLKVGTYLHLIKTKLNKVVIWDESMVTKVTVYVWNINMFKNNE